VIDKSDLSDVQRVYIKFYKGGSFNILISLFVPNKKIDQQGFLGSAASLGLTLTAFEEAPLSLNALEINNVFGDKNDVVNLFQGHYR